MSYTGELNEEQQRAVETIEGPVIVLAGAGAGKTKVITHRILNLVNSGVAACEILAVTFTNKAAGEMRERVRKLLSENRQRFQRAAEEEPFISTFHSLGVRILKEHARLLGLTRHFAIFDRSDSVKAIKEGIVTLGLDPKQFEPRKILGTISKQKGDGITLPVYQEEYGREYYPRIVARIWEKYESILLRERALDFDDLLLKTVELLERKEVREKYQNTWRYIHIDEYQDTNLVQYKIMHLLLGEEQNVFVVGDIDQSIYSWRGARIENILRFEENFPHATLILLEQNYRSTKTIIEIANDIIVKNLRRRKKHLFTENEEGEPPVLYGAYDEHDEARFVTEEVEQLIERGVRSDQIAVLYRTNFQSRVLEDMFLYNDIPYRLIGTKFFERREVKDVLSYLRCALHTESVTDLKRIITVPPRGIGKITLLKVIEKKTSELPASAQERVQNFFHLLERVREQIATAPAAETIKFVIKETGLEELYTTSGTEDDTDRLENMYELVTLATRYHYLEPLESIEKLLEEAALAQDQDELQEEAEGVTLMTVHAAKGLEFPYVFITGLEEGLFPHERGEHDPAADGEEERRLFYVALTRAEKRVFLSYAMRRTIYGNEQIHTASQFITDINPDKLAAVDNSSVSGKTIYLE